MTKTRQTVPRIFWLWLAMVTILTTTGVVWLRATGVNPAEGFSPAIIVIAYSSSLAALVASGVGGGWSAVGRLLAQIGRWRFALRWYAIALFLPVIIVGAAQLLYRQAGGLSHTSLLDMSGLATGFGAIIAGSLGEEIGWRGFAQPTLQKRFSIFWASIVVGLIWATWHCWPLFAPGGHEHRWALDVVLTYVRLVPTAVLYGWLYNVSGKSLLVVMLAHAAHNIAIDSMPVPDTAYGLAALIALFYLASAVVVTWFARRQLFAYPKVARK